MIFVAFSNAKPGFYEFATDVNVGFGLILKAPQIPPEPTESLAPPPACPVKASLTAFGVYAALTAQAPRLFHGCRLRRECRTPCLTRGNRPQKPLGRSRSGLIFPGKRKGSLFSSQKP